MQIPATTASLPNLIPFDLLFMAILLSWLVGFKVPMSNMGAMRAFGG
jgi:hypothetical protein